MEVQIEADITDFDEIENLEDEFDDNTEVHISQDESPKAFPGVETAVVMTIIKTGSDIALIIIAIDRLRKAASSFSLSADVDTEIAAEEFIDRHVADDGKDVELVEKRARSEGAQYIYRESKTGLKHILDVNEDGEIEHYTAEY